LVEGNFVHEIGHQQKQSSFYFQAETAQCTLQNNIVFNIPRAAINFNDGFGGGSVLTQNLLFNTCRESSDHGQCQLLLVSMCAAVLLWEKSSLFSAGIPIHGFKNRGTLHFGVQHYYSIASCAHLLHQVIRSCILSNCAIQFVPTETPSSTSVSAFTHT
jgi:hypothetical protein